jgi:hypothetical protein
LSLGWLLAATIEAVGMAPTIYRAATDTTLPTGYEVGAS